MLPTDPKARKDIPVATGCLDYFPDALAAVAELSRIGNEQHNPGQPLRWDRSKSGDEADAMMRHFLQRGTLDTDDIRHSAKVAWRALALLQKEIEAASKAPPVPASLLEHAHQAGAAIQATLSPESSPYHRTLEERVACYVADYHVSRTAAIDALGLRGFVQP